MNLNFSKFTFQRKADTAREGTNESSTEIRCRHYFNVISRGIFHKCMSKTRVENLSATIQNAGPSVDQFISSLLKCRRIIIQHYRQLCH